MTETPDGLTVDDQLSLLLGRVARRHVESEWQLRAMIEDLRRLAPGAPRAKIDNSFAAVLSACQALVPQLTDTHERLGRAADAVLGLARDANQLRNRALHDWWVLSFTDGTVEGAPLVRVERGANLSFKIDDSDAVVYVQAALDRLELLLDLLAGLQWAVWNVTHPAEAPASGMPTDVLVRQLEAGLASAGTTPPCTHGS